MATSSVREESSLGLTQDGSTSSFPPQLIDHIFSELPLSTRQFLLFKWNEIFSKPPSSQLLQYKQDATSILATLTILDFSNNRATGKALYNILHLPLTNIAHVNLSNTPIGDDPYIHEALCHPMFHNIASLDLSRTNISPLPTALSANHNFPNLTTLSLGGNYDLSIPGPDDLASLPSLRTLDLFSTTLSSTTALRLMQSPKLATLEEFTWTTTPSVDDALLSELIRCPNARNWKKMRLDWTTISPQSITKLMSNDTSTNMLMDGGNLQSLSFFRTPLSIAAMKSISTSPLLSTITSLSLSSTGMTDAGLQFLSRSPYLSNLKELDLTSTQLTSSSIRPLLDNLTQLGTKLRKLDLSSSQILLDDLDAIATSPCLSNLQELNLSSVSIVTGSHDNNGRNNNNDDNNDNTSVTDIAIRRLASSPNLSELRSFSIAWLGFGSYPRQGCNATTIAMLLSSSTFSRQLIELSLCGHAIDDGGISALLTLLTLQQLSLNKCGLRPEAVRQLLQSPNLSGLNQLDLSHNPLIGDTAIAALTSSIDLPQFQPLPNLIELVLSRCDVTTADCQKLAQSQVLDQLQRLYLNWNQQIGQDGLKALFRSTLTSNLVDFDVGACGYEFSREELEQEGLLQYFGDCELYQ